MLCSEIAFPNVPVLPLLYMGQNPSSGLTRCSNLVIPGSYCIHGCHMSWKCGAVPDWGVCVHILESLKGVLRITASFIANSRKSTQSNHSLGREQKGGITHSTIQLALEQAGWLRLRRIQYKDWDCCFTTVGKGRLVPFPRIGLQQH